MTPEQFPLLARLGVFDSIPTGQRRHWVFSYDPGDGDEGRVFRAVNSVEDMSGSPVSLVSYWAAENPFGVVAHRDDPDEIARAFISEITDFLHQPTLVVNVQVLPEIAFKIVPQPAMGLYNCIELRITNFNAEDLAGLVTGHRDIFYKPFRGTAIIYRPSFAPTVPVTPVAPVPPQVNPDYSTQQPPVVGAVNSSQFTQSFQIPQSAFPGPVTYPNNYAFWGAADPLPDQHRSQFHSDTGEYHKTGYTRPQPQSSDDVEISERSRRAIEESEGGIDLEELKRSAEQIRKEREQEQQQYPAQRQAADKAFEEVTEQMKRTLSELAKKSDEPQQLSTAQTDDGDVDDLFTTNEEEVSNTSTGEAQDPLKDTPLPPPPQSDNDETAK